MTAFPYDRGKPCCQVGSTVLIPQRENGAQKGALLEAPAQKVTEAGFAWVLGVFNSRATVLAAPMLLCKANGFFQVFLLARSSAQLENRRQHRHQLGDRSQRAFPATVSDTSLAGDAALLVRFRPCSTGTLWPWGHRGTWKRRFKWKEREEVGRRVGRCPGPWRRGGA